MFAYLSDTSSSFVVAPGPRRSSINNQCSGYDCCISSNNLPFQMMVFHTTLALSVNQARCNKVSHKSSSESSNIGECHTTPPAKICFVLRNPKQVICDWCGAGAEVCVYHMIEGQREKVRCDEAAVWRRGGVNNRTEMFDTVCVPASALLLFEFEITAE
ncbi:hypothetical protein J6590_075331 [Homalodisca vitripennis]|nr:hypothetical protein J6590_075331 [Homalodisca vitripennis]